MGTKALILRGVMQTVSQNQNRTQSLPVMQHKRTEIDVQQLLREYRQTGSPQLRDRIVLQFSSLVESIGRRFSGTMETADDLTQEGYIGLITAIDLYDPSKNVKFSTYATHFIIGQIKHSLRDRGKIIKEPAWLQELNQRMTRAIEKLTQQFSRPPSNLEIARVMDMTEEAVADLMMSREVFKVSSIDGSSQTEDDNGAVNMDRQVTNDVAVSFQLPIEDRIVLEAAMEKLKDLEQKVVTKFYFKGLNQSEIAAQLGISCNYVSHILRNSAKKLKKILVSDDVRDARHRAATVRRQTEEHRSLSEKKALVDPLTRLYNGQYFETRLDEELSRASLLGSEVSVLFVRVIGLDPFLRAHGLLKRDEAVLGIARVINACVRRVDIVTRYEENNFAVILPYTGKNIDVVFQRLEEVLTELLAGAAWNAGKCPLSTEIGVAVFPRDGVHAESLIALSQSGRAVAMEAPLLRAA